MPRLKQLSCCVQWSDTNTPFQEYGPVYGDGVVEAFIIVPNKPQGFSIRLTSQGYISEGLAAVVFIDGNYQCNRARVNLLPTKKGRPASKTEIDFLMRQKEKPQGNAMYMGRGWRFDNHNLVEETPEGFQESHFDDLGTIEILVLRCRATSKENADYEGSSSGEDSEVLGQKPAQQNTKEGDESMALKSETNNPPSTQMQSTPQELVEEVGSLFGLFDGANDYHDHSYEAGRSRDKISGQWVWHQREAPSEVYSTSSSHLSQADQSSSSSPSHLSGQQSHRKFGDDQTYFESQQKRVHFDYGPGRNSQPTSSYTSTPSYQGTYQYPPERPSSRERLRRNESYQAYQTYPRQPPFGPPYDPQVVHSQPSSEQQKEEQILHSAATLSSKYQNGPDLRWQQSTNPPDWKRFSLHSQNPQIHSAKYRGETSDHVQGRKAQEGYYINNDRYAVPPNYLQHPSYHEDVKQLPQQIHHVGNHTVPFHPIHPYPPENPPLQAPQSYYPHPMPIIPHSQQYPGTFPGPWPAYLPHLYTDMLYRTEKPCYGGAPIINPLGSGVENVSPKNTTVNTTDAGFVANGNLQVPVGSGEDARSAKDDKNNPSGSTNELNRQSNFDKTSGEGDNATTADQSGEWAKNPDTPNDNAAVDNGNNAWASDNMNQTNTGRDTGQTWDNNNTQNGDSNSNANADWGAGAYPPANNENAQTQWDSSNNATHNNANVGENHQNSNGAETGVQERPASMPEMMILPRELYGPHGPYYSFRALRVDDPKPDAEEEPRFDVPKPLATARGSSKQVQPGPGYRYFKKRVIPEYIDSLENPYARFVFKYRTKEQIFREAGISVDFEPSGNQEIQELQNIEKQALIEMLIRAKSALGGKVPSPPATPSNPATGSEIALPIAVKAPNCSYLKYTLPPSRPTKPELTPATHVDSQLAEETSNAKDSAGPSRKNTSQSGNNWDTQQKSNGWDGVNGQQSNATNSSQAQQRLPAKATQTAANCGTWQLDDSCPSRPPTPNVADWNADTSGANNSGIWW